ncbi:MAG: exodeoxyribonuclease III [Gammaproteobacteria bacterium]|nr:exodeoxyribonuclease III [Gammaproteobacteria bacterium]MDE0453653.1 exodeoxyribonuclease III [Gammaproteobacteria bacterium]
MRVATWNVNGVRARLDFIRIWLQERRPDIVGLQEIKTEADDFPHSTFEELGYEVVLHGQKGWNGVAVLSRLPVEDSFRGLAGQEEMGARLVGASIGGLTFATVYCPNGKSLEHEDFVGKLAWLDDLATFWSAQNVGQGILCGDFNVVPQAVDSWRGEDADGQIFHTVEERSRFDALLGAGLADLFREKNPDSRAFSWWDYRAGAFRFGHGLRIDFLLGTPPVLARVNQVEIDRDFRKKKEGLTASDHAPVIADLD